jgi:hypothetical protein
MSIAYGRTEAALTDYCSPSRRLLPRRPLRLNQETEVRSNPVPVRRGCATISGAVFARGDARSWPDSNRAGPALAPIHAPGAPSQMFVVESLALSRTAFHGFALGLRPRDIVLLARHRSLTFAARIGERCRNRTESDGRRPGFTAAGVRYPQFRKGDTP